MILGVAGLVLGGPPLAPLIVLGVPLAFLFGFA